MPAGIKVTEELFKKLKSELENNSPHIVAIANHISTKTVLQIKGSKTYEDYQDQVKAQHPPVKSTMREDIKKISEDVAELKRILKESPLILGRPYDN